MFSDAEATGVTADQITTVSHNDTVQQVAPKKHNEMKVK
jgi:hypothetical protein